MSNDRREVRVVLAGEDKFSGMFQRFERDLLSAASVTNNVARQVTSALAGIGTIAGGGAALGAITFVRSIANDLDALNDASDATGETISKLSALEDVARRNGESLDTVQNAILRLNKVLQEATPKSAQAELLKAIGLEAKALREQSPADALVAVAQALNQFDDNGNKARLQQDLLGKSTKELAAFLKDVAENGAGVARVTEEQARQAEVFNKALASMQTNISNSARSLGSELLPAVNATLAALNDEKLVNSAFSGIGAAARTAYEAIAVTTANVSFVFKGVGREIGAIGAQLAALGRGDIKGFTAISDAVKEDGVRARRELDALERRIMGFGTTTAGSENDPRRGRGFVGEAPRPSVPDTAGAGSAAARAAARQVSEVERYIETLQRQIDKTQNLSVYEQALADIQGNRLKVANAGERELVLNKARAVDLALKQADAQERLEASFQAVLRADDAKIDIARNLVSQTSTGRIASAIKQVDALRAAMNDPEFQDPAMQDALVAAAKKINADIKALTDGVTPAEDKFKSLQDTIESTMLNSANAIADFAVSGKGSVADIGKAFAQDVLRLIIVTPVQKAAREAAEALTKTLSSINLQSAATSSASFDWGGLFRSFFGLGGGGGGGGIQGNDVGLAFGKRGASGSGIGVAPGDKGFAVVPKAAGAATFVDNSVIHVNGDVSPKTIQLIEASRQRTKGEILRSMRTGGAFANG